MPPFTVLSCDNLPGKEGHLVVLFDFSSVIGMGESFACHLVLKIITRNSCFDLLLC